MYIFNFKNLKFSTKRISGIRTTSATLNFKNHYGVYVYNYFGDSCKHDLYDLHILYKGEVDRFSTIADNGILISITEEKINKIMKQIQKL